MPTGFASGAGLRDPLAAVTPQLSDDGMTVALLSTQPNYGEDPNFGLFDATKPPPANAFVVNMAPGLTRAQAITRLTDWASLNFNDRELASPVDEHRALRRRHARGVHHRAGRLPAGPAGADHPDAQPGRRGAAVRGQPASAARSRWSLSATTGSPPTKKSSRPALSEDGHTIALASGATNLVYGVVNQGSDIFTTEEVHSPAAPAQQSITPTPPWPAAEVPWNLSATATPSPDGTLELYVSVPGAGRLSASAVSAVGGGRPGLIQSARPSTQERQARRAARREARRRLGAQRERATAETPSAAQARQGPRTDRRDRSHAPPRTPTALRRSSCT